MESTDQVFESLDRRKTTRTMLAGVNPTAAPTAWLVKRELTSWRSLHLETSALRTPDLVTAVASAQIGALWSGAKTPREIAQAIVSEAGQYLVK